jgi:hypothetical protein
MVGKYIGRRTELVKPRASALDHGRRVFERRIRQSAGQSRLAPATLRPASVGVVCPGQAWKPDGSLRSRQRILRRPSGAGEGPKTLVKTRTDRLPNQPLALCKQEVTGSIPVGSTSRNPRKSGGFARRRRQGIGTSLRRRGHGGGIRSTRRTVRPDSSRRTLRATGARLRDPVS